MEKFNAMRTRLLQHLQKKAIRSRSIMTLVCLLLASASAFAQTKTVTGTVTDAANEPLIGASVLVQGTSTGTITDMDGKYSISVTPEDVLAFSYVGMTSQTVKVGTQNVINVTLKEDSQVLAETVVIGYGSAKKRDLTGSITNVKGEELANKPAMNPLSSLQGKVAGVQIVNSGRAGSDPEIRIRGTNSINGYKPLYIVDGLFNDNINFLNPEDIESMEILKEPVISGYLRCSRCEWCYHHYHKESQRGTDTGQYQHFFRFQESGGQGENGEWFAIQGTI